MNLRDVVDGLSSPRLHPCELPDEAGLYAVYGSPEVWRELRLGTPPDERPLYIGKSESSVMKEAFLTHFRDGKTASSTLRRSLAALLCEGSRFNARPRSSNAKQRFANFKLELSAETELTEWMLEKLEVGACWVPRGANLGQLEAKVLAHWNPPLNLTQSKNRWTKEVKWKRQQLAFQAKSWYFRHVANQVREVSCHGITLGTPEHLVSANSSVRAVHSRGERKAVLIASDEVTIDGLKLRRGTPFRDVIQRVPGTDSTEPYFHRGTFAGIITKHPDFWLFFRMEDEPRMAAVVLGASSFSPDTVDKGELALFLRSVDLMVHRTRHNLVLVLDSEESSILGVRLGLKKGTFQEPKGLDILYGFTSKEVIGVAGSEVCISDSLLRDGSEIVPMRAPKGKTMHFAPYLNCNRLVGFILGCGDLALHYNFYASKPRLDVAILTGPEALSTKRAKQYHSKVQERVRPRERDTEELAAEHSLQSRQVGLRLPYIPLEPNNPILPEHLKEYGGLIRLPGEEIGLDFSSSQKQQVLASAGSVFICAPAARTGCIAIIETESTRSDYTRFRVLARARLLDIDQSDSSGFRTCSFVEVPEHTNQSSDLVQGAFSRLKATIRTQIRYEEHNGCRRRWRELHAVEKPGMLAAYAVAYSNRDDKERQEFLDEDRLDIRLALARASVLKHRKSLRAGHESLEGYQGRAWEVVLVREECVWSKSLRNWDHAPAPTRSLATNPVAIGDSLIVTCSSPSRVRSISRSDGRVQWSRTLSRFSKAPLIARGILIVPTTDTIYALEPDRGRKLWEVCPYGTNNEWFYSYPFHSGGRLFFGDNNGQCNCIELQSGKWLWTIDCQAKRSTGRPFAMDGRAFFTTIKPRLSCHVAKTGHYLWTRDIDDHAVGALCSYGDGILACTKKSASIYHPESGELLSRWAPAAPGIRCFCVAEDMLVLHLREQPEDPGRIVCLIDGQEQWTVEAAPFVSQLRWDQFTNSLYEITYSGITAIDPNSGERMVEFVSPFPEPPSIADGHIYICTDNGRLYAVKFPAAKRSS